MAEDEEKIRRAYLMLGEQVALGRTRAKPLTYEAAIAVIHEQYREIQRLNGSLNDKRTQDDAG